MTRKVTTCTQSETISSVMERMTTGKFRHVPVVAQDSSASCRSATWSTTGSRRWSANPKRSAITFRQPSNKLLKVVTSINREGCSVHFVEILAFTATLPRERSSHGLIVADGSGAATKNCAQMPAVAPVCPASIGS
jgi:hypothetical protein